MAYGSDNNIGEQRYLSLNDDDREGLLDSVVPKNTKNATKNWINVLNSYLKVKKIANNVDEILTVDLPRTLEIFYSEVTKDNGKQKQKKSPKNLNENSNNNNECDQKVVKERYSNTSMRAMRAAIKRYIDHKREVDVISNEKFIRANKVFDAILKDNKAHGKGNVQHKPAISATDLERLNDYFSQYMRPNATILQQFVEFNLMFYLCRRGRENLTRMPKDTFEVHFNNVLLLEMHCKQ